MSADVAPDGAAAVEQLVRRFYTTTDPEERSALDAQLTTLQRRPEGFEIADRLLSSAFPEVQLYGANIFIVKIKSDLKTLDDGQRAELQSRLLEWLRSSMRSATSHPVMAKKVCSAVVECFIAAEGAWSDCIRDVMGLFIPTSGYSTEADGRALVAQIAETNRLGVIWFVSTLVEMVGARDSELASTYACS